MIKYEKAHPGEELKLLDFGNYVFSQAHRPHDFRALLPKVYKEGVESASFHYVAHDENNDIRGMVAALPQHLIICGQPLEVGSVGTMGVHPYARGEGHMKHIMKLMEDDCRQKGMDALVLGGRRQRYNYFGFEHAGANAVFTLNIDNLHHALNAVDESPITLVCLEDNNDPLTQACYDLYNEGLVCGARPREQYLDYQRSWTGDLFAIVKNGEFAGSLQECGSPRHLGEVLLKDESDLPAVLKRWFLSHPEVESTKLTVWPFEHERLRLLEDIAEHMTIDLCQMLYILNYKPALKALMTLNAHCKALEDGQVVLRIENEQLKLSVQNGVVSCEDTTDAPDLTLTAMAAQRLLFLPTRYLLPGPKALKNWLPLPWVMPTPDHF